MTRTNYEKGNTWLLKNRSLILMNTVMLLFCLLLTWIRPVKQLRRYDIRRDTTAFEECVMVYKGSKVEQSFICKTPVNAFELFVSVANGSHHGSFFVSLADSNGDLVEVWETDKLDIWGKWTEYKLKDTTLKPDEEYRIIITAPDLEKTEAVKIFIDSIQGVESLEEKIRINGDVENSRMILATFLEVHNWFALLAIIILFLMANIWWVNRDKSLGVTSGWLLLGMGLIMVLIMSPGSGPDERAHYYSSYQLSSVIMGKENISEIDSDHMFVYPERGAVNSTFVAEIDDIWEARNNTGNKVGYYAHKDRLFQPASHLAQALGITIGRLLNGNLIQIYTWGRMFNLIGYVAMCSMAIYLIPCNKELLFFLCAMPMCMHQASMLSYDAMINGLSFLFFSFILWKIYNSTSFSWKDVGICLLILGLFCPVKVVYFILAGLVFAVPEKQFRSRFDKCFKGMSVFLGTLFIVFLSKWTDIVVKFSGEGGRVITDRYTLSFVLREPVRFLRLVLRSTELQLWNYIKQAVGISLGGLTVSIPEYLIVVYIIILCICALTNERFVFTGYQRVLFCLVSITGILIIIACFALVWTPYGAEYIEGVQGRYLIPVLAPAIFMLSDHRIQTGINKSSLFYPFWFIEIGYIVCVMGQVDYAL